ncbi:glycoside hydrolase [Clostridium sp. MB05]
MKSVVSLVTSIALMTSILVSNFGVSVKADSKSIDQGTRVYIDPKINYQTIEGWGTSLAWWANVLGNWKDQSKIDEVTKKLFSQSEGLGLNAVRYNIGAGGTLTPSLGKQPRIGASIESYQPSAGVWDWNADKGQRLILQKSKELGVDFYEAFSNSPPYWMTKSGSPAGNWNGSNNLKDDMYDDFANYLTEVIKYFKDNFGIEFDTVAALNEPNSIWWTSYNNQEGCHFDRDKQNLVIKELGRQLQEAGLNTTISAPEEYNINDTIASYLSYEQQSKDYITSIHTHTYAGDKRKELKELAANQNKSLWNSEVSLGGSSGHNHNDMTSAIEQANKIRTDIVDMGTTTWCYWQAVEDEAGGHNHGLIHANFQGEEEYYITKQYYSMANYAKFVKPGFKVIESNNSKTLAAYNESTDELVLVVTNDSNSNIPYNFDLSEFSGGEKIAKSYRTSDNENLAQLEDINITSDSLYVDSKANSITTYIISNISYKERENIALGKNAYTDNEEISKGNVVKNINDGNGITRWGANDGNKNHWVTIDLMETYDINSTEIIWEEKDKQYKYKIEVSSDNTNWIEVVNNLSDYNKIQSDRFNTIKARYVKLTILEPPAKYWASINELRVFKDDNLPYTILLNDNKKGSGINEFNYSNGWSYYNEQQGAYMKDNHYTSTKENTVSFKFNGNRVQIYGAKDSGMGIASIMIDGLDKGIIDYYNPSRLDGALIFDSGELLNGEHEVVIKCLGERKQSYFDNYITLDYVKVYSN